MDWLFTIITFLILPLCAVLLDTTAGLIASKRSNYSGSISNEDFTILVPIWGKAQYLENVSYLHQYGDRVLLCTTGDESTTFYEAIQKIADQNGFKIYIDPPQKKSGAAIQVAKNRATSGTIRDRLVKNALAFVKTAYVVPLDADTTTKEPIGALVGELVRRGIDIASIRLVLTNPKASLLTRFQYHEYQLAMQLRFLAPWMISGACHVAKTYVLHDIMNRHSLFFQGNDVETGLIAKARGYQVGHIPFEVYTAVPATWKGWFRQRLAWAGGEFRLFISNFGLVLKHPFFWFYGGFITIILFPLRWFSVIHPSLPLLATLGLYLICTVLLHWKTRNGWIFLLPFYCLFLSLIVTPLGILWYFKMAIKDKNFGVIRPNRKIAVHYVTQPVALVEEHP